MANRHFYFPFSLYPTKKSHFLIAYQTVCYQAEIFRKNINKFCTLSEDLTHSKQMNPKKYFFRFCSQEYIQQSHLFTTITLDINVLCVFFTFPTRMRKRHTVPHSAETLLYITYERAISKKQIFSHHNALWSKVKEWTEGTCVRCVWVVLYLLCIIMIGFVFFFFFAFSTAI